MHQFLRWLRIEDAGELSLTHLAVFVSLAVYVRHPDAIAAGFATSMIAHYGYKRYLRARAADKAQDARLDALEASVKASNDRMNAFTGAATIAGVRRG